MNQDSLLEAFPQNTLITEEGVYKVPDFGKYLRFLGMFLKDALSEVDYQSHNNGFYLVNDQFG